MLKVLVTAPVTDSILASSMCCYCSVEAVRITCMFGVVLMLVEEANAKTLLKSDGAKRVWKLASPGGRDHVRLSHRTMHRAMAKQLLLS